MSSINLAALLGLGLLLVMTQQSMQTSLRNPIAEIETSNCKITTLRLGLVFTSAGNERAILESGLYKPDNDVPYVDIAGRRFHIGSLNNTAIVYVKTGSVSVNVAAGVQTLFLRFRVSGIVLFGTSGSLDDETLALGDVAVPEAVAYTGVWDWKEFGTKVNPNEVALEFRDFNYPRNGDNLLASAEFDPVRLLSQGGETSKEVFWLPISTSWYEVANRALKDLELRRCYYDTCLVNQPKVVFGSRASTSDFYVANKDYGLFLRDSFNFSSVDRSSAPVALTSLSNEKLFVVFRGISNVVGGTSSTSQLNYLASYNAFLAATKFISSIPTPRIACE